MRELSAGDLGHLIVVVGWNSERFDGRNRALRLVALDYTQGYWYRRWPGYVEDDGMPETNLDVRPW